MSLGDKFWIPKKKWQLVEWLQRHYKYDLKGNEIFWNRFKQKQLFAIYLEKRKNIEKQRETITTSSPNKENTRQQQIEFTF